MQRFVEKTIFPMAGDDRPGMKIVGENAAIYARGEMPEPVVVPTEGEAMGARFHAQVALIYAIETSLTEDGAKPEDIEIAFLETPQ